MLTLKKALTGVALSTSLILSSGAALAEEWKFAIEEIPGSIMDAYAQEFKKQIERKTNGDVTVKIYPLGSLGTPTELIEHAADGVVQFTNVSVGNLGTIVPESQLFMLPYTLPGDNKATSNFLSSSTTIYNQMAQDFERKGLKLHTMYSEGEQVWTTNRLVRNPDDFNNFKMRVMVSPILLRAYEDMGASPTPLPFGEVYGALQLKQVDGQVNPAATIEEMKFYEVTDYLIWAGENQHLSTVISGTDWYESQSPERQKLIRETLAELNGYIYEVVERFNNEKLEKIKEAKPELNLVRLTAAEREAFQQRSTATRSAYTKIAGERGEELLSSLLDELGIQ
ncbi:TRAP transporter substrate-binding protein DctP [Pontibacterium granulatum]|uniref:TRAP transporter substrate-binding protein DctP n=1 Tax=Pontibacterium granulatum TaxID=2036029 RepID=UPI00249CE9D3|nr:TRAP transporter substrate-binding protein DctP [Pontibacterium granulatum]MDI3325272.1 TRAP transporter substrate-binding protein DctP [Pontibacterium granulatum]